MGAVGAAILLSIAASATEPAPVVAAACVQVLRPIAAGAVPVRSDVTEASCERRTEAAFRYDARLHAERAERDLKPGEVVVAAPAALMPAVSPGQVLYVTSHVGAVVIEREVRALQAAQPGQRMFVRGADGGVFAVTLSEEVR
jgi:flagella basal body P-ring formation protein FlgA